MTSKVKRISGRCFQKTELACTAFGAHEACHLPINDTAVDHDAPRAEIPSTTPQKPTEDCLSPLRLPSKGPRLFGDDSSFACPFWKFDSSAHTRCFSHHLTSIPHVKRHLARKHRPGFYCPRCLQVFNDEGESANHLRSAEGCSPSSERPLPFITTEQWWLLRTLKPKGSEQEAQVVSWFKIYGVLFLGQPQPHSPYLCHGLTEDLVNFHEYYTSYGSGILRDTLRQFDEDRNGRLIFGSATTETAMKNVINTVIHQIFAHWTASKPWTVELDSKPVVGSISDSRWSGSTLAHAESKWSGSTLGPADTSCSSDSSDFGGKRTCLNTN